MSNLGPQFLGYPQRGTLLEPHEVAGIKALDFKGNIGDPDPVGRMEHWQSLFGGTTEARHYDEGDSPTKHVERLRADVRQHGVQYPIHVNEWGDGSRSLSDGHHRAVAAYLEGQRVPARIRVYKDI